MASNTRSFSTWGRASLTIPDLRVAAGVTLNGVALVADESYYLIPDHNQSGVFTGIELPQNRYALSPGLNTFDINYNHLGSRRDTLPNDLVIDGGAGGWGHIPLPDELLQATKVLAAYYTIRPDALLSGAKQTPEGNTFDLSGLPPEVDEFIRNWKIAPDTVASI